MSFTDDFFKELAKELEKQKKKKGASTANSTRRYDVYNPNEDSHAESIISAGSVRNNTEKRESDLSLSRDEEEERANIMESLTGGKADILSKGNTWMPTTQFKPTDTMNRVAELKKEIAEIDALLDKPLVEQFFDGDTWKELYADITGEKSERDVLKEIKKSYQDEIDRLQGVTRTEKKSSWFKLPKNASLAEMISAVGATLLDTAVSGVEGMAKPFEGVSDLILHGGSELAGAVGLEDVEDFLHDSATLDSIGDLADEIREGYIEDNTIYGDKGRGIPEAIGQIVGIGKVGQAFQLAGKGAAAISSATTGTMFASSMGSGISEAYQHGEQYEKQISEAMKELDEMLSTGVITREAYDKEIARLEELREQNSVSSGEAWSYGLMKGTIDAVSELAFGGLGEGVNALGYSRGLSSLDDAFAKKLSNKIASVYTNQHLQRVVGNGVEYVVKAGAEGIEEVFAGLGTAAAKKLSYMSDEELTKLIEDENLLEQFVVSFIASGVVQGGDLSQSIKNDIDFITGLNNNEQAVVDKEVEKRIEEAEKDGTKLSNKDKNKIVEQVKADLDKGYISTDTIEEVLGGNSLKEYQDTVKSEDSLVEEEKSLRDEYEELGKKTNPSLAEQSRFGKLEQQLDELNTKIEDTKKTSQRDFLQRKYKSEVYEIAKGSRLVESYNEIARRGQAFEADVSKYDEKQRAIVQKAIDSGILNNSNRSHEFVDIVAKISADKGVSFDFVNNAKLKESGFAVDGKMVNGYVTKDGIAINMDSPKAWQSTVGHEITHVLEGTELYTELQNALFEYAKSKGDYQGRLDTLTKLYEGVEGADINAELTADLVGDYLFQDADFVNNLSTKHRNVFQKIYDEIKYLIKVTTAGTKEARELEKVKHVFEQAYKEQGEAQSDTKFSLSETTDGRIAAVVDNDILSNIDTNSWDDAKKETAKKAASEALKQFADGIVVDGITRKVNRISRREFTRSKYTEHLYNTNPDVFADKMRAADIADDIVIATTNWNRDGGLKHPRSDKFVDFDHGHALIVSGNRKYSAEVVVGITSKGEAVLYDVVDMTPTTFDIKNAEPSTTATTQNAPGDINEDSAGNSVPQTEGNVNTQFSLSSDNDGNALSDGQREFFKDSKIVDENGNLRVMYHGTPNGEFTIFRDGTYFTANKEYADKYQNPSASSLNSRKVATSPKTFEVYLNITKPFDINDPEARSIYINDYIKGGNAIGINPYLSDAEYDNIRTIDWTEGEDLREFLVENGYDYDGLVLDEGAVGGYGEDVEYRGTSYVVFSPEQVKNIDNQNPTSDPDIRFSLSDVGDAPVGKGTPLRDLRLETLSEDVYDPSFDAPVENAQETPQELFPDDYAPMSENEGATEERLASLNESDMPPEMEAPHYGEEETSAPADPFENRDMKEVGNRRVKAYMYENPEVKPFFQEEANIMLGELNDTVKGERIYSEEGGWMGTSRYTSDDIAYLRDSLGYTYAEIEKGLNAIIEDDGAENNAISKRIEFILNDRLADGYTDFRTGMGIPANQEYINLLNEKQITDYSREAWDNFIAEADRYAPPAEDDIAPVLATAPKAEYEAIRPRRQTAAEAIDDDIAPIGENVEYGDKLVRADSPFGKERKWVGTSTESKPVKGKVLPDDLNQETIHYQPISNKTTLGNANARLDKMGFESSVSYFNSQFAGKKVTLDDIALGERLIQEAVKRGDTKTAGELIQNVAILGTELGQKVQALSIIKRLTPEGQLGMLQKVVERGKTKGDKAYDGVELTQEMIDKILAVYGKDGTFDQKKLNEAVEKVKKDIADQMKVTKMDKVNAWRYLSMLGNPKTHIRNLVSNVAMKGTVAVKNVVARTMESVAPIKNRTKTWKAASDDVKAFAKTTTAEMKDVLSDGGKYSEDASIKEKRQIFKNKILNGLYEFNSDLLTKEDWWFSRPAFQNALSEYLTANGIRTAEDIKNNPKLVEKAKLYATEQSQIATFRQYSWLANKINDIERHNTATDIAVGAVLPFKKTPINIAKTGLNYSPLGFAKTLTYDASQVKNGKMEASEMIDHLAQNVTGSALTLIGYLLASAGFISGGGDDDKEGEYDYQLGRQSYAVNIGGKSFSLSWLSPVSMPLFVGANAYEQLVEGKEWNGDVVVETLAQTLDPLSEMSFLSGLNQVLSSYDSGLQKFAGIGESMIQNYATQFVPTLSSQVATVMDDTKRSTKVAADSDFKFFDETINKLKLKIPGLRETLEPTTDIWGNEVKQTENVLTRAFETFLAPYSKKDNIATEIDAEIKSLYSETGDNGIIPSIPYNYVNYDNVKYEMSGSEYTAYKKTYGQTAYNLLEKLFGTATYQNASSEERAELVNKVYDYARDTAKMGLLSGRGVTFTNATKDGVDYYKENAIKGAIENDMSVDEYSYSRENPEMYKFLKSIDVTFDQYKDADDFTRDAYTWAYKNPSKYTLSKAVASDVVTYRTYTSELYDIKADKDEDGKSISGSRKEKVIDYINNLDADYGEKIILFKSEYPSDDTYNYDIIDYLNSRDDISYGEMNTILLELGFKIASDGITITWD